MDWPSFLAGFVIAALVSGIAWVIAAGRRTLRRVRSTQDEIYDRAMRSALDQPYKR